MNPYSKILEDVNNDPERIQALFEAEWTERKSDSRSKLYENGVAVDPILSKLLTDPEYQDRRNCLCVWARPSAAVAQLVSQCQRMLQKLSPNLWVTPQDCLHTTVLVIANSVTPKALGTLVFRAKPAVYQIANHNLNHCTRLIKPRLSYDVNGVALSFVPAAGKLSNDGEVQESYTYLHLRRDIFDICRGHGLEMDAQKPPASCYLAVARFITDVDHCSNGKPNHSAIAAWIDGIERINDMLMKEYWPIEGNVPEGGDWVIGKTGDLVVRQGTNWYGGGQTVDVDLES